MSRPCDALPASQQHRGDLPQEAYALALAGLPSQTPRRLSLLLDGRSPDQAWESLAADRPRVPAPLTQALGAVAEAVVRSWNHHLRDRHVEEVWERHDAASVGVLSRSSAGYPTEAFEGVSWPPELLVHRGSLDLLAGARVAIVGTRACTEQGRETAARLGSDLAEAGVAVVSGLALGIDAAAHLGALRAGGAPAIGVVGSGLDVVYPARNASLWRAVATEGLLVSEHPLGTQPLARHFPARNRILAALADVVVVVESHDRGGALGTAAAARRMGRTVMAVPGPVGSGASRGSNDLLADGAGVCRDAGDVLVALGMTPGARRPAGERRAQPSGEAGTVLEALGWSPATASALVERSGLSLGVVSIALAELIDTGWVAERGGWYERLSRAAGP